MYHRWPQCFSVRPFRVVLLFIAASPRLRRGHVAARLRASAFTCSLSSVKEGLSLLLQLPPTRELKHCVCKLPPTGKHTCAVCGASDVGAKSHFFSDLFFAAAGKAQLPVRPLLCTHFLFGSVLGRRTYGLHTKTQGPEPIDSFIQSHIHFKVNLSRALDKSPT